MLNILLVCNNGYEVQALNYSCHHVIITIFNAKNIKGSCSSLDFLKIGSYVIELKTEIRLPNDQRIACQFTEK